MRDAVHTVLPTILSPQVPSTMKRRLLRRPTFRLHKPRFEILEERAVMNATAWSSFAGNSQHTSVSSVTSQPMEAVHWSTPVDNFLHRVRLTMAVHW